MAKVIRFIPEAAYNAPIALRHRGKVYYEIDLETSNKRELHRGSFLAELNPRCTVYLTDQLWFGKYNLYNGTDMTVKDIVERDPEYIAYLIRERIVILDAAVVNAYNKQINLAR